MKNTVFVALCYQ